MRLKLLSGVERASESVAKRIRPYRYHCCGCGTGCSTSLGLDAYEPLAARLAHGDILTVPSTSRLLR